MTNNKARKDQIIINFDVRNAELMIRTVGVQKDVGLADGILQPRNIIQVFL